MRLLGHYERRKAVQGLRRCYSSPSLPGMGDAAGAGKPRADEKDLARFAVEVIRKNGGVLEHPEWSTLWSDRTMPQPGAAPDIFGGWSLSVDQFWWGHRARKRTWLYVVGISPAEIPVWPLRLDAITHVVARSKRKGVRRPELSKKEREATPVEFARYLISIIDKIKARK